MKAVKTILGIVLCLFLVTIILDLMPLIFAFIWQVIYFVVPFLIVCAIIVGIVHLFGNRRSKP